MNGIFYTVPELRNPYDSTTWGPECARGFHDFAGAAEFLKSELRAGDLALLRGQAFHHLGRICYLLDGTIACTRTHCERRILCDDCELLKFRHAPDN